MYDDDPFQPDDAALDRAVTAVHLLETTEHLCARSCALAAQTGSLEELRMHAEFVADCITRPAQTRAMARDFMLLAARGARRRLGADEDLDPLQYVAALELVATFEEHVLAHVPVA